MLIDSWLSRERMKITLRRDLPVPLPAAYAWLTDYQDDDPDRTTAVVKRRPVVERSGNRVVLEGTLSILGNTRSGKVEVLLYPPDHWVATILEGSGRGSVYTYRLTPTATGCRLTVDYSFPVRRLSARIKVWLATPLIRRELTKMWDGFEASMAKELGVAAQPPA